MSVAIRADGLGKRYRLRPQERYRTLRDTLVRPWTLFRSSAASPDFWALKDVSFSVPVGSVTGIVGANGAGKSTLLKLVSRITEPTEGSVTIRGRVGSLLEIGTGFHPELTGRENVYLYGAILGMTRAEMRRKFDSIVAFAEVEKFLDTPVKHYSSGMHMRLAFSVAAHLEPEILVIDEVLAVGDVRFQKKCLAKVGEMNGEGRTVLFVSHSMPTISRLCGSSLFLREGQVVEFGPTAKVIASYLQSHDGTQSSRRWERDRAPGDDAVRLREVRVVAENGVEKDTFTLAEPLKIEVRYEVLESGWVLLPGVFVTNQDGVVLFQTHDWEKRAREMGTYHNSVTIPADLLAEGTFYVTVGIGTPSPLVRHLKEKDVVRFQIVEPQEGSPERDLWGGDLPGVIRPHLPWRVRFENGRKAA